MWCNGNGQLVLRGRSGELLCIVANPLLDSLGYRRMMACSVAVGLLNLGCTFVFGFTTTLFSSFCRGLEVGLNVCSLACV